MDEWSGFKLIMSQKRKIYHEKIKQEMLKVTDQLRLKELQKFGLNCNPTSFWDDSIQDAVLREICPNCVKLFYLLMIFPLSAACVE